MSVESRISFLKRIFTLAPLILLFLSVLNEFDFNYLNYRYFSFNFPFILIFYWSLKRSESLGYGYIFLAGLFIWWSGLLGLDLYIVPIFVALLMMAFQNSNQSQLNQFFEWLQLISEKISSKVLLWILFSHGFMVNVLASEVFIFAI